MFCWAFSFCLLMVEPDPKALEKLVNDALKAWEVPGLAVAVVRGDDTLILQGFGRRALDRPEPVSPDTVFPLASCSKAFTTTLLAMLADDEVINWNDPVRKHLKEFKLADSKADALLTLRDLLCHRCGIGGHDLLWYRAPWSIDEIVKRAQLLPLDYPFRAGYRYSSIPYLIAGRALEERMGKKWDALVQSRICEPLGMTGVSFTTTSIPNGAERAKGYRVGKGGKIEPMAAYEIREPNPSGSVNATARDMAAWLKFHIAQGVGPDGKRRVSVKNLTETHTPQNLIPMQGAAKTLNPDTVQLTYGMGWIVYDHRGKKVISHGGIIDGFRVQLTFLPDEKLGIALLCNLHDTRMTNALTNTLVDQFCGLEARDWNTHYRKVVDEEAADRKRALDARDRARDPEKKPSLPLSSYAGEFDNPAYGVAKVAEKAGRLTLRYGVIVYPLEHFEGDTFRISEGPFAEQLIPFTATDRRVAELKFAGQQFKSK